MPDCFASHMQVKGPGPFRSKLVDPGPGGKIREGQPPWITNCQDAPASWRVPSGLSYYDFFGKGMEENRAGFPNLAHHKKKKQARMCLVYYATGKCTRGYNCAMAHLPFREIGEAKKKIATNRYQVVYSTGKGAKN